MDAGELNPGEKLKGNLDLITDCGEEKLPYEITIVSPVLRDEEGEIRDYPTLKKRIEKNPEHGVDLFWHRSSGMPFYIGMRAGAFYTTVC